MNPMTRITTFINLTPHRISIILASGEELHIEAQPESARVTQSHTVITRSDDGDQSGRSVEIAAPVYGEIVGLPAPVPTVAYITSVFVANAAAAKGRTDVLYPDSGPDAVRERGQVVAVRRLLTPVAQAESADGGVNVIMAAAAAVTKAKANGHDIAIVDIGLSNAMPLPRDGGPVAKSAIATLKDAGYHARLDGRGGYIEIVL